MAEKEYVVAWVADGIPEVRGNVVRCKNCWKRDYDNCPFYDTLDFKPDDEWFCADGEVKLNG